MKDSKSLLLAAILAAFTSSAMAAAEGKLYAAIDVGQGNAATACEGLPADFSCKSTSTAYRAGMGYQLSKHVGFEAAYLNAGKVKASGTVVDGLGNDLGLTASAKATGFQLSVIGALPVTSGVELLGKVGVASLKGKASYTETYLGWSFTESTSQGNTNLTYGLGVRFAVNDKIRVRVMYEDLGKVKVDSTESGEKVTFLSAGLEVGF